mgnify:CR=1 FL=1
MFRSLILAAVLLAFTPLAANAGEITLLPSIKLQIGDRDNYGNYWDGGRWRGPGLRGTITMSGEKYAGGVMTTATIVAGTNAKLMSAVIVKAGTIVTTIAVAGVATNIIINVTKGPTGPFVFTNRVRFLPTARY